MRSTTRRRSRQSWQSRRRCSSERRACSRRRGRPEEEGPRAAESRIVAVTVYQGTALVTREVAVPAPRPGPSTLVVSPLPPEAIDGSLYTEADAPAPGPEHPVAGPAPSARTPARRSAPRDRRSPGSGARSSGSSRSSRSTEKDLQLLDKLEGFTAATLLAADREGGPRRRVDDRAGRPHHDRTLGRSPTEQVEHRQQIEDTERGDPLRRARARRASRPAPAARSATRCSPSSRPARPPGSSG